MVSKTVVISAPMSFSGAAERTKNWLWREKPVWYKLVMGWWAAQIVVLLWWTGVFSWYLMFGLLVAPYRLIGRGSRNRKLEAKRQELLEALKAKDQA